MARKFWLSVFVVIVASVSVFCLSGPARAGGLSISGTIVDRETGTTPAGGWWTDSTYVNVWDANGHLVGDVYASRDGSFAIEGLPAGLYKVCTRNGQGYVDEWYSGDPVTQDLNGAAATQVNLLSGSASLSFSLSVGRTISGSFLDERTNKPITHWQPSDHVQIYDESGEDVTGSLYWGCSAGADGTYTATSLAPGKYKLLAHPDAYFYTWYENVKEVGDPSGEGASWVDVTGGSAQGVDFVLTPDHWIIGSVRAVDGKPITDVDVVLCNEQGQELRRLSTGGGGSYVFAYLAPGRFKVRTESGGSYVDAWYGGGPTAGDPSGATATVVDNSAYHVWGVNISLAYVLRPPTGVSAKDHPSDNGRALDLSWTASPGASGYRLYRGMSSGSYDHEIDVGNLTSYVDTNLTPGQTYYYILRAYDSPGHLTGPSVEASAAPKNNLEGTKITRRISDTIAAYAQIKNGRVAWLAVEGDTTELCLYDIASGETTQVAPYDNWEFQTDGAHVVWLDYRGDYPTILLYDVASGRTTQVTHSGYPSPPKIDGGQVVWADETGLNIYLYDASNGQTMQVTNNAAGDFDISDGKVVYQGWADGHSALFLYDTTSGRTTEVPNTNSVSPPQIDGGHVVWTCGWPATGLFLYDIGSGQTIQVAALSGEPQQLSISGEKVVWMDGPIYCYDIASGQTTQVANELNYGVEDVRTDGAYVVWWGWVSDSPALFLYDMGSGQTTEVSRNCWDLCGPQIDGGQLVWCGLAGDDPAIFLYADYQAAPSAPIGLEVNDHPNDNGQALDLSWTATPGASGYRLYRGTSSGNYAHEVDLGNLTHYVDTNLTPGQTYHYVLREYGTAGDISGPSAEVSVAPADNGTNADVGWVPAGSQATVEAGGTTITFDEVTVPGTLTVTPIVPSGDQPSGFRLLSSGWSVDPGTLSFTGGATITFPYDPAVLPAGVQEADLTIWHFENGAWQDVTVPPVDMASHVVTARVNALSPFALGVPTNRPPVVTQIQAAPLLLPPGTAVTLTGTFTDPDTLDSHSGAWNWGDSSTSTGTVTESSGSGSVAGSHVYTRPGSYTVSLTVTDNHGASSTASAQYVKILGVALYSGGDASLTGSCKVGSPLVAGQPSAATYVNGKLTTNGSVDLSRTVLYVKAKGATVPPPSQFMPAGLVASLTLASQVAQPTGTTYNGLSYSGAKSVTLTQPITVNGNLTISGSGSYSFDSVYVTGNVSVSGSANVTFASLRVGGTLSASGSGSYHLGPTYAAGNVTLSGSGQFAGSLLVTSGALSITGSMTIGGDGTGTHAKPVRILVVGASKTITLSGSGTIYGELYDQTGSVTQSGSGVIRGQVLCGGSYTASGSGDVEYDQTVLDNLS